jgi:hypothetical protein
MNPEALAVPTPTAPPTDTPKPTPFDTLRARFMFLLGFVYLLLVAGVVHRATSKTVSEFELHAMMVGIVALWPIFVVEVVVGILQRDRSKSLWPFVWRALLVWLMPPWRMALTDPRTGLIWIPRMGWKPPGKELFQRLEYAFSGPMLLFAFLVLPVLLLEFFGGEEVKSNAAFVLGLDIGIGVVWVAFATEFVFKASAHPKPFTFATDHWLDATIVLLPMLEFVLTQWVDAAPLVRLLRLGRVLSPEQIARMQRLYRLRGVAEKGWRALFLIEAVSRLFGQTPQKRLAKLEEKIAEMEADLNELRKDADAVRESIAATQAKNIESEKVAL